MIYLAISLYILAGLSVMALFLYIDQIAECANDLSLQMKAETPLLKNVMIDNFWLKIVIVAFWPIFGVASLRGLFDA